ncbi:hypothetical protein RMSM_06875 [Rhodopirellula maiorica SM1]|uniref:Uncharacterized protein n=1 Tax=Rhodopirellula maiorica SM1 TaxID=1265738 RepID=M5RLE9_9BACT|nr:hypothetical protein RMSM_06875 [Rhodopirellula maiorica SM1]
MCTVTLSVAIDNITMTLQIGDNSKLNATSLPIRLLLGKSLL